MKLEDDLDIIIIVNIEDRARFSLTMTRADFSLWNKTEADEAEFPERPWLDLMDFPLEAESTSPDVLHSSGLLSGLAEMFPACSSLSCVVSQCPQQGERQHCCDWVLGHSLLSQPGYPQEMTSNYISFSRLSACHPAQEFSLSSCPVGWDRAQYQCVKQVNSLVGRPYRQTGDCSRSQPQL